jgi:hypothetical protein
MEVFDEILAVRNPLISDEQQLEEIEFVEASVAFANTHNNGKDATELEVDLLNKFMKGETSPFMRKAWVAYRKRLLRHHRREG